MFGADYRKVSFWHKDAAGNTDITEREYPWLEGKTENYMRAYREGKLGLQPIQSSELISFFIHAHEHHGMSYHPAAIGWMTESLLQQRGIPYFVNNDTHDSSYTFNPETKHIERLPDRIKISHWA
jgi:hypothetical protein